MANVELHGKPIVITGASSGIGRATAIACAGAGMPVVLGARRETMLRDAVEQITRAGGRAVAVPCDVTDPAACERLIQAGVDAFGSVYAVFANAGYGFERAMHETSQAKLRAIFETNFWGTMNVIYPALPRMIADRSGHILICSSCLGKLPIPYYGHYSATKAAQNHVGRAMRLELAEFGVHVSTVHPIGTKTEFFDTAKARSGDDEVLTSHSPDVFMQSPAFVAKKIVACLRRPRAEVWTGFSGHFVRFGMSVCTLFPWIADRSLSGLVRKRRALIERETARRRGDQVASS